MRGKPTKRGEPRHAMGTRQIYEVLRDQIRASVFGTHGRLPSSRALAVELGVSRTTVTVAYKQLLAEGFSGFIRTPDRVSLPLCP